MIFSRSISNMSVSLNAVREALPLLIEDGKTDENKKTIILKLLCGFPPSGKVDTMIGPMCCGKSSWLRNGYLKSTIRSKYRWTEHNKETILKPQMDDRADDSDFDVHDTLTSSGESKIRILRGKKIWEIILKYPEELFSMNVILIDEGHMFPDLIEGVLFLKKICKKIMVAALDADSDCKPFSNVMQLIAYSDKVVKNSSICVSCGKSAPHTFLMKDKVRDDSVKQKEAEELKLDFVPVVGGTDIFKPLCLTCYRQASAGKLKFDK